MGVGNMVGSFIGGAALLQRWVSIIDSEIISCPHAYVFDFLSFVRSSASKEWLVRYSVVRFRNVFVVFDKTDVAYVRHLSS
jgi:hypothetical protein